MMTKPPETEKITRSEAKNFDFDKARCPYCSAKGINYRKTKEPYFRCKSCFTNFYKPKLGKFHQDKNDERVKEKIKKLFFKKHKTIYNIMMSELNWTISTVNRRYRRNYVAKILGFDNYKDAQKKHKQMMNKERLKAGFTQNLKKMILERDNKKCCLCGSDSDLEVHHIDGNFKNNSKINLITLCKKCHLNKAHEGNNMSVKSNIKTILHKKALRNLKEPFTDNKR